MVRCAWAVGLVALVGVFATGCETPCDETAGWILEQQAKYYDQVWQLQCSIDPVTGIWTGTHPQEQCGQETNFRVPACYFPGQKDGDTCVVGKPASVWSGGLSAPAFSFHCVSQGNQYESPGMEGCVFAAQGSLQSASLSEAKFDVINAASTPGEDGLYPTQIGAKFKPIPKYHVGAGCIAHMLALANPGTPYTVVPWGSLVDGKQVYQVKTSPWSVDCNPQVTNGVYKKEVPEGAVAFHVSCGNGRWDGTKYTGACGKTIQEACSASGYQAPDCLAALQGSVSVPIVGLFPAPLDEEVICLPPMNSAPMLGAARPLLELGPVDPIELKKIRPLGQVNPTEHTFPVNHLYLHGANTAGFEVRTPARGRVTFLQKCLVPASETADCTNVTPTHCRSVNAQFWPFRDYTVTLDHLQELTPSPMTDAFAPGPNRVSMCTTPGCPLETNVFGAVGAPGGWRHCDLYGQAQLQSSGMVIGHAARSELPGSGTAAFVTGALDFGVHDLRASNPGTTIAGAFDGPEYEFFFGDGIAIPPGLAIAAEAIGGLTRATCPMDGMRGSAEPAANSDYAEYMNKLTDSANDNDVDPVMSTVVAEWPTPTWSPGQPWPKCGFVMQDDATSAQGMWFAEGGPAGFLKEGKSDLFLGNYAVNAAGEGQVASFGSGQGVRIAYLPVDNGMINPKLSDIKPGLGVYCLEPDNGEALRLLIQLKHPSQILAVINTGYRCQTLAIPPTLSGTTPSGTPIALTLVR